MDYSSSPLGVLDGTARSISLSGRLVSSGRRAPPKACYFGKFYHTLAVDPWAHCHPLEGHQPTLQSPLDQIFTRDGKATDFGSTP